MVRHAHSCSLIEWLTSGKPFGGVERDNVRVTAGREILPTSGRLAVRRESNRNDDRIGRTRVIPASARSVALVVSLIALLAAPTGAAADWPFYGGDLANSRSGGTAGPSTSQVVTLSQTWRFDTKQGDITGTPVLADGTLVVGSNGGWVFALNSATGKLKWSHQVDGAVNGSAAIVSNPLVRGGGLVSLAAAKPGRPHLVALRLRTGKILQHFQATPNDVWTLADPSGPDAYFGASPNLFRDAKGRALVGEGQKSVVYWALDRATLKPVWNTRVGPGGASGGILGSTAYDGTRIYGPNTAGNLVWALDRAGALKWVSKAVGPLNFGPATVSNGVVYIADFNGVVTARDAATGLPLAQLPIGSPSFGGVAVVGKAVYAAVG